jgi:hypothetical protein
MNITNQLHPSPEHAGLSFGGADHVNAIRVTWSIEHQ